MEELSVLYHPITIMLLYFAVINAVAFIAMGRDKKKAVRRQYRTPESVLFLYAVMGGTPGAIAGMRCFRHKTRKPAFYIGLPLLLALQILCGVILAVTSDGISFL